MSNYYQELRDEEWTDVSWDDDKAYGPIEDDNGRLIQSVASIGGDLMTQKESWEKSGRPAEWVVIGGGGYAHCRIP